MMPSSLRSFGGNVNLSIYGNKDMEATIGRIAPNLFGPAASNMLVQTLIFLRHPRVNAEVQHVVIAGSAERRLNVYVELILFRHEAG